MRRVVGVPHSGCRTLSDYLGAPKQHFLYDQRFRLVAGDEVHVPIRNPSSVAESWARRGKDVKQLLARYDYMFEYLSRMQPKLWRIEDLPKLAGLNDTDVQPGNLPAIAEYVDLVMAEVVGPHAEFFAGFNYE